MQLLGQLTAIGYGSCLDIGFHTPFTYTQTSTTLTMTRRGLTKSGKSIQPRVAALQKKEKRLATELQWVRSAIANTHGSPDAIPQHTASSSSIPAVRIQPGSQSVIHLQGERLIIPIRLRFRTGSRMEVDAFLLRMPLRFQLEPHSKNFYILPTIFHNLLRIIPNWVLRMVV
jgi:hypothetical protein